MLDYQHSRYAGNAFFEALTAREKEIVLFRDMISPPDALEREECMDVCHAVSIVAVSDLYHFMCL